MRLGFALLLVGLAFAGHADAHPSRCMEDRPCFNWRTMGNHQRGIVTVGGRRLVVTAVRFDRLNRAFRIDWDRSSRLRGDGVRFDVHDY